MNKIPLTRGMFATVDDADFKRWGKFKWFAQKSHVGFAPSFYAARRHGHDGKLLLLHRVILQASGSIEVDHWDGNTLDCRRKNLRRVTSQQNSWNQAKTKKKTSSQFKGVCYVPQLSKTRPWIAYIGGATKSRSRTPRQYLGYHESQEAAARAYDVKAKQLFGEFARLNFP